MGTTGYAVAVSDGPPKWSAPFTLDPPIISASLQSPSDPIARARAEYVHDVISIDEFEARVETALREAL